MPKAHIKHCEFSPGAIINTRECSKHGDTMQICAVNLKEQLLFYRVEQSDVIPVYFACIVFELLLRIILFHYRFWSTSHCKIFPSRRSGFNCPTMHSSIK